MTSRSRNILVGVVVLFSMAALGWMILRFSNNTFASVFSKGLEFRITADRADGVSPGSTLFYLGVPVGQVTEVRRIPDNTGVVMQARLNSTEQVPSMISPQLMSMSSSWHCHKAVLLASLSEGVGMKPKAEPRPVVKQIRFAPLATWPVTAHGSKPGLSMKVKPLAVTGSAYL